jgi:outer membrane protein TolC
MPARLLAAALAALLAVGPLPAQEALDIDYSLSNGSFWNLGIYRPRDVPEADLADSMRLDRLIRDGKLYLSLADALALSLENNLDIAVARYSPLEAQADLLRAKAGANLSGVQTQISTLSTGQSVGGGGGGGAQGPSGQATGITQSASQAAQTAAGGTGNAASFFGTQTVNLDPQITGAFGLNRSSNPQISSFVIGQNTLISDFGFTNIGYQQGFITGTTFNIGLTTFRQSNNNTRNSFNPTLTGDISASITQRLTQGFGRAINSRNIRIARNNQEIEDLNFEEQVISTVGGVQQLYWDLVALRDQAAARRADVELADKLVADTGKQAELGLQAQIEVTRSRAEATSFRQQLVQAETLVKEQQEILKNAITKHGPTSATLAGVEIIPTDHIVIPEIAPVEPLPDMIEAAMRSRPALSRSRINLENSEISLRGIKNALKPSLDLTASATNNGLAGTLNPDVIVLPDAPQPDQYFVGGISTVFGQLFRRNFPDYGVRLSLNIPLKNRQAQADMTRELLRRRRQDIQLRQQENAIKLEVARALATLQQEHENYRIAVEARELREQMADAERKRLALGSSTIFAIIQAQRDLSTARTAEVNAARSYTSARIDIERVTGRTLRANNISIAEAYSGEVSKEPDPIPPALIERP